MTNAARRIDDGAATQETATVVSLEGELVSVRASAGAYRARRAAGCLLRPEVGDLVLVASTRDDAWVLSVLERAGGVASRVDFEGDVRLCAPGGRLSVTSRDGVDVATGAAVSVVSAELNAHAPSGTLAVDTLSLLGGVVQVDVGRVRLAAGAVEQVVDRLTQRAKRVVRFVEEFEELRAGRIDYVARTMLNLRGRAAAVTGETLVKVDSAQVHIG